MSKPTLDVPGIDPARIVCAEFETHQWVYLDRVWVVNFSTSGDFALRASTDDQKAVVIAAFDHWRATGRLFPEPPPEPVECVCGGKPAIAHSGFGVWCVHPKCNLRANTVEQWNTMQAALKAAKEKS